VLDLTNQNARGSVTHCIPRYNAQPPKGLLRFILSFIESRSASLQITKIYPDTHYFSDHIAKFQADVPTKSVETGMLKHVM
jgi:hypothetical protein